MASYTYEQETTLNHDPATDTWYLWTNEARWLGWARKYAESYPEVIKSEKDDREHNAMAVIFPGDWMRMPLPKRKVSEETKAKKAEQLARARAQRARKQDPEG